jgi:hypothetical protein
MGVASTCSLIGGTRIECFMKNMGIESCTMLVFEVGEKLCWRLERSDDLVRIQSQVPEVSNSDSDPPIWNSSRKGKYSCSETWETI